MPYIQVPKALTPRVHIPNERPDNTVFEVARPRTVLLRNNFRDERDRNFKIITHAQIHTHTVTHTHAHTCTHTPI